ncbi:MAG: TolC family protein [Gammaproteobacteria bacterium]
MSTPQSGLIGAFLLVSLPVAATDLLSLPQAIDMALQYRLELQGARLSRQSAGLGVSAVESELGWQANASAGWQHGLDMFGQPSEQQRLAAGLMKRQRSGDEISLQGSYQKDDSDIAGSSLFPNPMESYGVHLDYRMPLQQGKHNPQYAYAETQAQMELAIAVAQQQATAEQIAEQLIGIYHRLLEIQIQIAENQRAIERTLRLERFVQKNTRLGLAERKDRLSVQARLAAQRADGKRLQREWSTQLTQLRRMTGRTQDNVEVMNYESTRGIPLVISDIQQQVVQRDAVVISNRERLALTESLLQLNRDRQKDQLDMVLSLGNETRQGERAGGALDENEWVGGVRLEYQLPLDRRGVDARSRQTLLELDRIRLENERYETDLKNQLQQWFEEWQMAAETTQQYRLRQEIEQLKYQEVNGRYREGRTDIREMLEAEETLSTAERLLAQEEARQSLVLALLSNRLGVFTTSNGN